MKNVLHGNFAKAAGDIEGNLKWMGKEAYDAATRPAKRKRLPVTLVSSSRRGGPTKFVKNMRLQRRVGGASASSSRPRKRFVGNYRYTGKFRRPKSKGTSTLSTMGAMLKTEKGGAADHDKCLYIGHSTAGREQVLRIVCMAIIRRLARMCGFHINTFQDRVDFVGGTNSPGGIQYFYSSNEDGNIVAQRSFDVPANSTWDDVVGDLMTDLATAVTATSFSFRLLEIWYFPYSNEAANVVSHRFKLNLRKSMIKLVASSNMKIQNRTRAHTEIGVESAAAAQSVLNVENNPLTGKSYLVNGNGFRLNWSNDTTNTFNLYSHETTGVIDGGDIDGTGLTTELIDLLKRPPHRNMFKGVKHSGGVVLQPGEIKSSHLSYQCFVSLDKIMQNLHGHIEDGSKHQFWNAKSKMFAFEKMMNTTDAEEPSINIGYEVNNFYGAILYPHKQRILVEKQVL